MPQRITILPLLGDTPDLKGAIRRAMSILRLECESLDADAAASTV
ncbi:MAG: hypothetical protein RDU25_01005 [Patescibacteria group bacterium]|nr:hypothetical protein [Patescibacteria group bacterium]